MSLQTAQKTPTLMHDMAVTRDRVAEVLADLRRLHGTAEKALSQEKAAQRADVSTRDWNRWENKHTTPHPSTLGKIADAFEIPLDSFDDGAVDHSALPLTERLDRIERLVTAIAQKVGAEVEVKDYEAARSDAEASEPTPGTAPRKPRAKQKTPAAQPKPAQRS